MGGYFEDNFYLIRYVDVYINNWRLIDLVCQFENSHFGRQRSADFCGYVGLHITDHPFHVNVFPGILPNLMGSSKYWGAVLTCTCGIDLCSCIAARVEILGDFILWHEVLNP